jgi:class 3 adenylate cyclase
MGDDSVDCEIAAVSSGTLPQMHQIKEKTLSESEVVENSLRAVAGFIDGSNVIAKASASRRLRISVDGDNLRKDVEVHPQESGMIPDNALDVKEALTLPIQCCHDADSRPNTPTLLGRNTPLWFPKQSCWKGTREKEALDAKTLNAKKKVSWFMCHEKTEGTSGGGAVQTSSSKRSNGTSSTRSSWALRFLSASTINRIDSLTSIIHSRSRSSRDKTSEGTPKSPQTPRDNVHKLLQRRLTLKPNRLTQGQIGEVFNLGKSGLLAHHRTSGPRGVKLWWVLVGMFLFFMFLLAAAVNVMWYIDNQMTFDSLTELNEEIFRKIAKANQDRNTRASVAELRSYMESRTDELNLQSRQHLLFLSAVSCAIILLGVLVFGRFAQYTSRLLIRTVKRGTQAVANLDFDMCENLPDPETGMVGYRQSTIREVIEMRDSFGQLANGLRSFAKYMDPYVVQLLVQSRRQATLGVARADVTIFFSDIANFTTIAEALEPTVFMEFFSVYLEEMSRIIMDCSGLVGEFIGDSIMAWWNVPVELGEFHTRVALTAALLQQVKLAELRDEWIANGLPEVQSRMGLVRGDVLAGNIGSAQRMKYGLVGDSVNLASRLEGLCGRYGVNILIEQTSKLAPGVEEEFYLRPVDLVIVKGRSHPTELYEVVACKSDGPMAPTIGHDLCAKYCNDFAHIQNLYRARNFQDALVAIGDYESSFPDDKAAKNMRERCLALMEDPPGIH